MSHVVVKTVQIPPRVVCACGETLEGETYDKARLAHVRHALAKRHEVGHEAEEEPF